jgi:predicted GNAT superfamily acetyltransferase
MDRLGSNDGWLVIFDRDFEKLWDQNFSWLTAEYKSVSIYNDRYLLEQSSRKYLIFN